VFEVSPRARFAGEFAAIVNRQSFSGALEEGVELMADQAEKSEYARGQSWREIWDRSDGSPAVAWALLIAEKPLPFVHKLQMVRNFMLHHERFFFKRDGKTLIARRDHIETLWSYISNGTLPEHWEKTKERDAFATGDKMGEILKKAGHRPPAWGPGHE
jgi:hypothetical protein